MSELEEVRKLQQQVEEEEKQRKEEQVAHLVVSRKVSVAALHGFEPPTRSSTLLASVQWYVFMVLIDARFDALIGIVILVNSVTVGVQASFELQGLNTDIFENLLEHVFLGIYTVELLMRFFTMGYKCLHNGWVVFDFVLVCMGVLTSWILVPILVAASNGKIQDIDGLAPLMVLRVLRILRLARSLRLIVQFQTLWMLVRGLLTSAGPIFYTFVLLALMLYVFACMGIELIAKSDFLKENEETKVLIRDGWSSLLTIMLTLVQFVTLDSVGGIYAPLIHADWTLAVYFISFILIVSVTTMNLVTAVIVEGALTQAREDKEVKLAYEAKRVSALLPQLKQMFLDLDEDGSGTLSLDEVLNAPDEVQEQLGKIGGCDQLPVMFELLDADGSGELSVEEFCDGILQMVSSNESLEFIRMRKILSSNKVKMDAVKQCLADIESKTEMIIEKQAKTAQRISATLNRLESKLANRAKSSKPRSLSVKSVSIGSKYYQCE
eukprot:TRINITY_DN42027_c0_g1_i1.p1 TRINITY_DN42027_c0_g1~~TRINITY_DN42027_c0_g1_i1.p1  ORF type:complete len:494 (+),score=91.05 TRINITY_DN42027_c0_g1_i1:225-1706(+)